MVRQGWFSHGAPSRWMCEGVARTSPPPPSQQWPMASKNTMGGDRETQSWAVVSETSGGTRQSQEPRSRIGCFGSRRQLREEQIQEVHRCAKEGRQAVRVNPDIVKAEAVAKVERLQKALDALGGLGGPEVDAIKRALKKAQEVARGRPIAELIKEFIDRSTKRISKSKTERPIDTVGSTSSASWRSCCCRRGTSVDVATNGESVERGTRFVVSGAVPESRGEGETVVRGRSTRCQCHSPHPRSLSGSRGVDERQESTNTDQTTSDPRSCTQTWSHRMRDIPVETPEVRGRRKTRPCVLMLELTRGAGPRLVRDIFWCWDFSHVTHMFICLDSHRSLVRIVSLLDDAIVSILDQKRDCDCTEHGKRSRRMKHLL